MGMLHSYRTFSTVLLVWLIANCQVAFAGTTQYEVSLNTTPLIGQSAGPFYLAFVLSDGNGLADGGSAATVSNVNFDGGEGSGSSIVVGGVSGSLESDVTLTTSDFIGAFAESFLPGKTLRFTLTITSTKPRTEGFPPDRLTMFILDGTGTPLATLAPTHTDYFLGINFFPEEAKPDLFGSDPSRPPFTGVPILLQAPNVGE